MSHHVTINVTINVRDGRDGHVHASMPAASVKLILTTNAGWTRREVTVALIRATAADFTRRGTEAEVGSKDAQLVQGQDQR